MKPDITLIAMSGGVDSSAAACLLKEEGRSLIGITMRMWEDSREIDARNGTCCSAEDADDARRVAERLKIPHYSLNVKNEFRKSVVDNFVGEYFAGRTPNPCVWCNQVLKFDYLFKQGEKFGARYVATGHYARVGSFMDKKVLMRGVDRSKDQSYFLFSTPPDKLARILFPLGSYLKTETRKIAGRFGLNVTGKKESQEICFIPDNDYVRFLESQNESLQSTQGDIVNSSGDTLGRHKGFIQFTIGQRRGIGIGNSSPLYVTAIEPENNRVVVGAQSEVYGSALLARDMNWFISPENFSGLPLTAKIRYRHEDSSASVVMNSDNKAVVEFARPELAIAPGQAVVLYHGDIVIGGGWIEKKLN